MKILIAFICTLLAVNAISIEEKWSSFKEKYGRQYRSRLEESKRYQAFKENIVKVEEHNAKFERGEVSYKLAINKFADLTEEEFKARLMSLPPAKVESSTTVFENDDDDVPDEIDWIDKGAVTRVKDQGNCGSCWAFASVGALESHYYLKTGEKLEFSEQFLLDCSLWNRGCDGGWILNVFRDVRNIGITTEEGYRSYDATERTCSGNGTYFLGMGYVAVQQHEDAMKAAVGKVGPLAVHIDASYLSLYDGGVFDSSDCSSTITNHVVLITGYGTTDDGLDYWEAKNSWGNDWGDDGYLKMSRNKNGQCGIATAPFYPIV